MTPNHKHLIRLILVATGSCMAAAGCAENGPPKHEVTGSVKLDGKPLTQGGITFISVDGKSLATTEIVDGNYRIPASDGLTTGLYQVEIASIVPTGQKVKNPDVPGETMELDQNLIPARYNVRTQLKAEVKVGGSQTFAFDLASEKTTNKPKQRRAY